MNVGKARDSVAAAATRYGGSSGSRRPVNTAMSAGPRNRVAREIVVHTGLGHGFLYRPLPEWLNPVVEWAGAR